MRPNGLFLPRGNKLGCLERKNNKFFVKLLSGIFCSKHSSLFLLQNYLVAKTTESPKHLVAETFSCHIFKLPNQPTVLKILHSKLQSYMLYIKIIVLYVRYLRIKIQLLIVDDTFFL